ncbi:hypothetical protein BOX15_Mlig031592g1, partial [Macrostomum lignano]
SAMPLASNAQSYEGSRVLAGLSTAAGLSLDKMNFIAAQLAALLIGIALRRARCGSNLLRWVHIGAGVWLLWFCFGLQSVHMMVQASVAYCLMYCLPVSDSSLPAWLSVAWSLAYLSANHVYRLYNDYGGYTMDITGPLMILTQKLSSLALALHDGHLAKRGRLRGSESRWCHRVDELPSVLDYLAYSYYLPTLMAGPHVFYSDFIAHFTAHTNSNEDKQYLNRAVLRALACTGLYSFLVLGLGPMLPYYWVVSDTFAQLSLPRRILYVSGAFFLVRCKYYFAWSLAEAACLAHGFGFSGTDPSTGKPRYDLAKSFFFKDVEIGTSIRAVVAGWNVSTARWLRELVYERSPGRHATLLTFALSALWHGFYPGYYCFFVTFAVFTFTARRVRRLVRPHFQTSRSASLAYDCLTGLCANLAQNYAQGVFFLLEMGYALRFWSAMYFAGHILCAMLLLCLPSQPGVASDLMCFAQKYIVPYSCCLVAWLPTYLAQRYREYFPAAVVEARPDGKKRR